MKNFEMVLEKHCINAVHLPGISTIESAGLDGTVIWPRVGLLGSAIVKISESAAFVPAFNQMSLGLVSVGLFW